MQLQVDLSCRRMRASWCLDCGHTQSLSQFQGKKPCVMCVCNIAVLYSNYPDVYFCTILRHLYKWHVQKINSLAVFGTVTIFLTRCASCGEVRVVSSVKDQALSSQNSAFALFLLGTCKPGAGHFLASLVKSQAAGRVFNHIEQARPAHLIAHAGSHPLIIPCIPANSP